MKAAFKCQDTLDYIGMIYDNTMQGEDFPDVYLLNGDELEEAYLYGLAMEMRMEDLMRGHPKSQ